MLKSENNMIRDCARLFSYAKPHWKMFVLALVCMGFFTLLNGVQLALVKPVIDRLTKGDIAGFSMGEHNLQNEKDLTDIVGNLKEKAVSKIKNTSFMSGFGKISNKITSSFTSIGIFAAILAPFIFILNCHNI